MTDTNNGGQLTASDVNSGEVIPPAPPASADAKAGSNAELKALHADLTRLYRDYLQLAQSNPKLINPGMISLIQTFLKNNQITGEAPQHAEVADLHKKLLAQRRRRREEALEQKTVTLHR